MESGHGEAPLENGEMVYSPPVSGPGPLKGDCHTSQGRASPCPHGAPSGGDSST